MARVAGHRPNRQPIAIGGTIVSAELAEEDGQGFVFIDPLWESCEECHGTGEQCTGGVCMECPECGGERGFYEDEED